MTPAAKVTDPQALREQAERLRAEAAQAEAELRAAERAEWERLEARRAAWDRDLIASWDAAPLERAVEETRAALQKAIEESPLTQALAAYLEAQGRLREMRNEVVYAQGRAGRDITGYQPGPTPSADTLSDYVRTTAERMAADAVRQEIDALAADRNGTETS